MLKKLKYLKLITVALFLSHMAYPQTILTLEKALEIAAENSPSVIQARLNLEGREAALKAQRAALKSKIALNITPFEYSRERSFNNFYSLWNTETTISSSGGLTVSQPITPTDGTITLRNNTGWVQSYSEFQDTTVTSYFNSLYLEFNQPLFTYNRTKLNLESLELDFENAKLRYAIEKLTIEQNVTRYFYQVHSNLKSMNIAEEELKNRQQSYEIIKNKVDAGLSAREEFIQAEIDMTSSQASFYSQKVNLDNAKDQLKQVVGLPLEDEIEVLADISTDSLEVDLQKAVDFALLNRMELRQREIDIRNAYMNLIQQKSVNEFKGNLSLSMGLSGDNVRLANIYDQPTTTPRVGVSVEIPIYDWGQRKALIRQAETNIEASELSLKEEKKNIKLQIRQIYRNLQNLKFQIRIQEKNIENAQLTYEINLERYKNGDLTSMDLNLFQNQLSSSKIDLIRAIIEYKLELLNLKIESLWDFENNRPVIENKTN